MFAVEDHRVLPGAGFGVPGYCKTERFGVLDMDSKLVKKGLRWVGIGGTMNYWIRKIRTGMDLRLLCSKGGPENFYRKDSQAQRTAKKCNMFTVLRRVLCFR